MAFFGAYALLNLTIYYYALPQFKGIKRCKETLGQWGFWNLCLSMFFLCLIFLIAGVLQTCLERFPAGVLMTVWHLFTLRPEREKA